MPGECNLRRWIDGVTTAWSMARIMAVLLPRGCVIVSLFRLGDPVVRSCSYPDMGIPPELAQRARTDLDVENPGTRVALAHRCCRQPA